jgi:hypothetical protein
LFHCGGAGDVTIGQTDGGESGDGAGADVGASHDGGGSGKDAAGDDATTSSSSSSSGGDGGGGADTGAASSSGGDSGEGPETGAADTGAGEGSADSGPADTGSSADAGAADTGLLDTGSSDTGSADTGATDSGGSDGSSIDSGGGDTGAGDGGAHDGGAGDAGDGGSSATAQFRVAALMPSPAAIDFCWQQGGGAWNGPVMLGWSISQRLAYQQLTQYVKVPVAAITVRIVASTATDCTTSAGDVVVTPPAANTSYLVSSFSNGNVAPQVKAFPDELTTSGATNTNLRAIHAALVLTAGSTAPQALPVDFYLAGTALTTVLFNDVPYAATAPAGAGVDADGYLARDFVTNVDLRVRLHTGAIDLLDVANFSTTGGHVYSLFTTGVHNLLPTNQTPMKLVVCDDTAAPVGHLGVCSVVGTDI